MTQVVRSKLGLTPVQASLLIPQPGEPSPKWRLSLCRDTVPQNKPHLLKVENVFIGCPVSGPGWGVEGRSGAPPLPSTSQGNLWKKVQIPHGPPTMACKPENFNT